MTSLFIAMANRNNFTIHGHNESDYFPLYQSLHQKLLSLPDNSVYINHCNYMDSLPSEDYVWINVAREPVDRDQSFYYYSVSDNRGKRAEQALKDREQDPCGCAAMEYDTCIKFLATTPSCSGHLVRSSNAHSYFSVAPNSTLVDKHGVIQHVLPGFAAEQAFDVIRKKYLFVGLVEQLELTIMALEKLLPRFFQGMHAHYRANIDSGNTAKVIKNKTIITNAKTHTSLNGAVSTQARELVEAHNPGEVALYRNITKLFWWKISQILPEEINFQ
jgi:hypothetical protein